MQCSVPTTEVKDRQQQLDALGGGDALIFQPQVHVYARGSDNDNQDSVLNLVDSLLQSGSNGTASANQHKLHTVNASNNHTDILTSFNLPDGCLELLLRGFNISLLIFGTGEQQHNSATPLHTTAGAVKQLLVQAAQALTAAFQLPANQAKFQQLDHNCQLIALWALISDRHYCNLLTDEVLGDIKQCCGVPGEWLTVKSISEVRKVFKVASRCANSAQRNTGASNKSPHKVAYCPEGQPAHIFGSLSLLGCAGSVHSILTIVDLRALHHTAASESPGKAGSSSCQQSARQICSTQLSSITRLIQQLAAHQTDQTGSPIKLNLRNCRLTRAVAPLICGNTCCHYLATLGSSPCQISSNKTLLRLLSEAQTVEVGSLWIRNGSNPTAPANPLQALENLRQLSSQAASSSRQQQPQLQQHGFAGSSAGRVLTRSATTPAPRHFSGDQHGNKSDGQQVQPGQPPVMSVLSSSDPSGVPTMSRTNSVARSGQTTNGHTPPSLPRHSVTTVTLPSTAHGTPLTSPHGNRPLIAPLDMAVLQKQRSVSRRYGPSMPSTPTSAATTPGRSRYAVMSAATAAPAVPQLPNSQPHEQQTMAAGAAWSANSGRPTNVTQQPEIQMQQQQQQYHQQHHQQPGMALVQGASPRCMQQAPAPLPSMVSMPPAETGSGDKNQQQQQLQQQPYSPRHLQAAPNQQVYPQLQHHQQEVQECDQPWPIISNNPAASSPQQPARTATTAAQQHGYHNTALDASWAQVLNDVGSTGYGSLAPGPQPTQPRQHPQQAIVPLPQQQQQQQQQWLQHQPHQQQQAATSFPMQQQQPHQQQQRQQPPAVSYSRQHSMLQGASQQARQLQQSPRVVSRQLSAASDRQQQQQQQPLQQLPAHVVSRQQSEARRLQQYEIPNSPRQQQQQLHNAQSAAVSRQHSQVHRMQHVDDAGSYTQQPLQLSSGVTQQSYKVQQHQEKQPSDYVVQHQPQQVQAGHAATQQSEVHLPPQPQLQQQQPHQQQQQQQQRTVVSHHAGQAPTSPHQAAHQHQQRQAVTAASTDSRLPAVVAGASPTVQQTPAQSAPFTAAAETETAAAAAQQVTTQQASGMDSARKLVQEAGDVQAMTPTSSSRARPAAVNRLSSKQAVLITSADAGDDGSSASCSDIAAVHTQATKPIGLRLGKEHPDSETSLSQPQSLQAHHTGTISSPRECTVNQVNVLDTHQSADSSKLGMEELEERLHELQARFGSILMDGGMLEQSTDGAATTANDDCSQQDGEVDEAAQHKPSQAAQQQQQQQQQQDSGRSSGSTRTRPGQVNSSSSRLGHGASSGHQHHALEAVSSAGHLFNRYASPDTLPSMTSLVQDSLLDIHQNTTAAAATAAAAGDHGDRLAGNSGRNTSTRSVTPAGMAAQRTAVPDSSRDVAVSPLQHLPPSPCRGAPSKQQMQQTKQPGIGHACWSAADYYDDDDLTGDQDEASEWDLDGEDSRDKNDSDDLNGASTY
eukprot:jgi/Chrzof1/14212/Cz08g29200.t1